MSRRKQSQIIRQRIIRHNRLQKLISGFTRTEEETKKLQKIKVNTMMEINLRYLRSEHNRYYKFPKEADQDSDEEEQFDIDLARKQNFLYDLRSQNQSNRILPIPSKILSLDSSRKINSLQLDRNNWQRQRILRLNIKSKQNLSLKKLTRKNSLADKIRKQRSNLKLPELRRQNLKTQIKVSEELQIQSVIGKKLITEVGQSGRMNGIEKYLKQMDEKRKQIGQKQPGTKKKLLFSSKVS